MLKAAITSVALLTGAVGGHAVYQQGVGNFHEVIEGELYRSAQPDAQDIARYKREFGIRSIVNLRDEPSGRWRQDEIRASRAAGIQLVDYPISSARVIDVAEAEKIASLLAGLPKPILIHCEHGSNRTSLVTAIYLDAVAQHSDFAALRQLSPYYGHFPIPAVGRPEMFQSYWTFMHESPL